MAAVWCEGMNEQVRKYALILSYIALLNKEIAKRSAKLEELRKKKEEKREPLNDRLDGLNFHCVIIDEVAGNGETEKTRNETKEN